MRQKIFAGLKMRGLREIAGLNQGVFAERLGISASYLNQIENNQRPLTAQVMVALAQNFSVDVGAFAHEDTEKLVSDLREALADPVFSGLVPNGQDLKTIVSNVPWFAHAFLGLHLAFRRTGERLHALDERYARNEEGGPPGVLMPYEEVREGQKKPLGSSLNLHDLILLEYPYAMVRPQTATFAGLVREHVRLTGMVRPIPFIRIE